MAACTRATSTPRILATSVTTLEEGLTPGRPSSRRTYVITDRPGAQTSFVASPAASRRAAKGGSSGSTSSRYSGSTPSAAARRGTKRGRGRSSPASHTLIRAGLESPKARARSSRFRPAACRAARSRSPRRSGRATAIPHRAARRSPPIAVHPSDAIRRPRWAHAVKTPASGDGPLAWTGGKLDGNWRMARRPGRSSTVALERYWRNSCNAYRYEVLVGPSLPDCEAPAGSTTRSNRPTLWCRVPVSASGPRGH